LRVVLFITLVKLFEVIQRHMKSMQEFEIIIDYMKNKLIFINNIAKSICLVS
jgi:hypothetical protein